VRAEGAAVSDRFAPDPTVAVPQVPVDDLRVDANGDRLRRRAAGLSDEVDLAVFPEYALTGFAADERLREVALPRDAARERLELVAEAADAAVIAGYAERDGAGVYNATAYVPPPDRAARDGPGSAATDGSDADATDDRSGFAVYRKRHLWDEESEWVEPGTDRVVVETPAGPTGLLTCYDLNFVAESAWFAERAVDALVVVGAWPADHAANWRLLCRARALDGVRWVVGAGRTGNSGGERAADEATYAGHSLVARPDGAVAAELDREPTTLTATLDRETLSAQRELVGAVGEQ
jgi:(R)-amidase